MDIDNEIELLELNIAELAEERDTADLEGDWDAVDHISDAIADVEEVLEALYEKRSLLP